MKNVLILSTVCVLAFSSCESKKEISEVGEVEAATPIVSNLEPTQFQEKSSQGILVDVRTAAEIAKGTIAGSLAMDYNQPDFLAHATQLPKDREIYLYCAVGGRSSKAGDLLIARGFTKVYNLEGGLTAWTAAGLPVIIPE